MAAKPLWIQVKRQRLDNEGGPAEQAKGEASDRKKLKAESGTTQQCGQAEADGKEGSCPAKAGLVSGEAAISEWDKFLLESSTCRQSKKLKALEACEACKKCKWTDVGTKGCKVCLGENYNQMRLTRAALEYCQRITKDYEPSTTEPSSFRERMSSSY